MVACCMFPPAQLQVVLQSYIQVQLISRLASQQLAFTFIKVSGMQKLNMCQFPAHPICLMYENPTMCAQEITV